MGSGDVMQISNELLTALTKAAEQGNELIKTPEKFVDEVYKHCPQTIKLNLLENALRNNLIINGICEMRSVDIITKLELMEFVYAGAFCKILIEKEYIDEKIVVDFLVPCLLRIAGIDLKCKVDKGQFSIIITDATAKSRKNIQITENNNEKQGEISYKEMLDFYCKKNSGNRIAFRIVRGTFFSMLLASFGLVFYKLISLPIYETDSNYIVSTLIAGALVPIMIIGIMFVVPMFEKYVAQENAVIINSQNKRDE
jgi:hypothetical protein